MTEKEKTSIVVSNDSNTLPTKAYVETLVLKLRDEFLAANDGLDVDFVRQTKWLNVDSKGNFIEKSGDTVVQNYGDTLTCVIAQGEQKFALWGTENSPEDGELIVAEDTLEAAEQSLQYWLDSNTDQTVKQRYSLDMIQSRYIAYIVLTSELADDMPRIYSLGLAPTSKIAYGQWVSDVYYGKFKAQGIPKRTSIKNVVTNITTESKVNRDKKNYIMLKFSAAELFDVQNYVKK